MKVKVIGAGLAGSEAAWQLANRGIPQPTRLLDLFRDPGLRTMVKEGRFVSLLENERLNTVLRFRNTEEKMRNIL